GRRRLSSATPGAPRPSARTRCGGARCCAPAWKANGAMPPCALPVATHGARPGARRLPTALPTLGQVALRLLLRALRGPLARRQLHAGAARLRESDGDRLLGGPCAVFALAHVLHLFANELAGLRRRRLAFPRIFVRALDRFFVRHPDLHPTGQRSARRVTTSPSDIRRAASHNTDHTARRAGRESRTSVQSITAASSLSPVCWPASPARAPVSAQAAACSF